MYDRSKRAVMPWAYKRLERSTGFITADLYFDALNWLDEVMHSPIELWEKWIPNAPVTKFVERYGQCNGVIGLGGELGYGEHMFSLFGPCSHILLPYEKDPNGYIHMGLQKKDVDAVLFPRSLELGVQIKSFGIPKPNQYFQRGGYDNKTNEWVDGYNEKLHYYLNNCKVPILALIDNETDDKLCFRTSVLNQILSEVDESDVMSGGLPLISYTQVHQAYIEFLTEFDKYLIP